MSTTPSERFSQALRRWAEVFMHQAMVEFRQYSKDSGLSMSQMSTLYYLFHSSRCGVSEIGDQLGVTHAAASQMIDRLVQQGLLERSEDPIDRRVKKITLTAGGRQIIHDSIEARWRWIETLSAGLNPDEQEEIMKALNILTAAASRLERSNPNEAGQIPEYSKE